MEDYKEITRIRPAARIISTIGEDLVGDSYAAIVELVKNAYDADASYVEIVFDYTEMDGNPVLKIEIKDDGHGMTTEVVLNKWLVPATKDKLDRRTSPNGRLFQGRKGIGRYAAAILGQELLLETVDQNNTQTQVYIDWQLFEEIEFLEDVEVVVERKNVNKSPGTVLHITATGHKLDQWRKPELASLTKELRKLKSPFESHTKDKFNINLAFFNCPFDEYNDQVFEIEAFPIIKLFDYRISGSIGKNGKVICTYENQSEQNLPSETLEFDISLPIELNYPGPVEFDFRVFDRDKEAVENLINKGLIDPISKNAIGKTEAKRLLNEVYGVNLYREGFRVRPYGNGGIDWLDLDKDRIQNPSVRVGNNQVVGFINVKPEELSHLIEKSARDGFKENTYYFGLVRLLKSVLARLEERRYIYRRNTGKGRHVKSVRQELNELFDYTSLTEQIKKKLSFTNAEDKTINEVAAIIQKEAEIKTKLLENIQSTIAIYQGQATLGKIVTVLLHEGRKPVSYFKQQSPNLVRWLEHYKAKKDWNDNLFDDITERLQTFRDQSEHLSQLFKRLDPLAKQNKGERRFFSLKNAINKAVSIFDATLIESQIDFRLECDDSIEIKGWEEDIIIAVTNLVENSVYWLNESKSDDKAISIVVENGEDIIIHYRDNGSGIDEDSIESGAIFEPGFSKKLHGTGLGLPIAGEAMERLGGSILAHYSDSGAYFTLELKK
ncbi:sensor histidine kinase [Croceimicrobium hydrocarbonivorans]|uniref:histidine kinase n=1 Tax=Croceimicrobium hydrocarbonivorans TaxID=2761580 RepID=A0A7H0VD51_9FLAO|nr:sensor histidine kinase [Croceimicrobium hydrocarbonivorans]QNR23649.1 sensor histidine kinase [Croceimicrobium hydrocarbonivorans]